jgi:hypothetical protein
MLPALSLTCSTAAPLAQGDMMKASRVHRFGPPEVISLEEIDRPEASDQEVVVRVNAAGVGPWDSWVRSGKSVLPQPLPLTLGSDVSGTVVALGAGVRGFKIGQAVYGVTNPRFTGAYAEYAAASASMLAAKPHRLSDVEAASVPVVAVTALQMLFHAKVRSGQRVLFLYPTTPLGATRVSSRRPIISTAPHRSLHPGRTANRSPDSIFSPPSRRWHPRRLRPPRRILPPDQPPWGNMLGKAVRSSRSRSRSGGPTAGI